MYRLDLICFEEPFRFSLREMRRLAEAPEAVCVVAEADGLAGFAIGERSGDMIYLVTLDVAPSCRRGGLARAMLRWIEERVPEGRGVELHVHTENVEAMRFYEREGFEAVEREQDFYGPGLDALVYWRERASGG